MDDEAALAAIAQSIDAAGGARCGVCLNYLAQPFCGMTGRPHQAAPTTQSSKRKAAEKNNSHHLHGGAASSSAPVASSSSCSPHVGSRREKKRGGHAAGSGHHHGHHPSYGYKHLHSYAPQGGEDTRVFPHCGGYHQALPSRGSSRYHARYHAYLAHHHATHHERERAGGTRLPAEILHAVYAYLLPWDALRLRLASKRTYQASLHPHLWKHWVDAVESLDSLRIPCVFRSEAVRRTWAQSIPKPKPSRWGSSVDYEKYKFYARAGVVRWRFDLEAWVPESVAGLKERQAVDIVNAVIEAEQCWTQVAKLTMSDVDDLHDVLSRLCAALASLCDVYTHIRPKNNKHHVAGLSTLLHRLREDTNVLTKIDQWMNCVIDNKFWDLLRIQVSKIGLTLPLTPSDCLVVLVVSMFSDYPDSFKPIWDITISAANDAFESEHGFESTSSLHDGLPNDAASSLPDAGPDAASAADEAQTHEDQNDHTDTTSLDLSGTNPQPGSDVTPLS